MTLTLLWCVRSLPRRPLFINVDLFYLVLSSLPLHLTRNKAVPISEGGKEPFTVVQLQQPPELLVPLKGISQGFTLLGIISLEPQRSPWWCHEEKFPRRNSCFVQFLSFTLRSLIFIPCTTSPLDCM